MAGLLTVDNIEWYDTCGVDIDDGLGAVLLSDGIDVFDVIVDDATGDGCVMDLAVCALFTDVCRCITFTC